MYYRWGYIAPFCAFSSWEKRCQLDISMYKMFFRHNNNTSIIVRDCFWEILILIPMETLIRKLEGGFLRR
jgi:hypothetical protein